MRGRRCHCKICLITTCIGPGRGVMWWNKYTCLYVKPWEGNPRSMKVSWILLSIYSAHEFGGSGWQCCLWNHYTWLPVNTWKICCFTYWPMPPSIFQLYRGSQFYWCKKPEFPVKTTELSQVTDKLDQILSNIVSITSRHERDSNSQL